VLPEVSVEPPNPTGRSPIAPKFFSRFYADKCRPAIYLQLLTLFYNVEYIVHSFTGKSPLMDCDEILHKGNIIIIVQVFYMSTLPRRGDCKGKIITVTGCLHVPIVGPTGRSDWSVRLVG